jgi:hypothetical protein
VSSSILSLHHFGSGEISVLTHRLPKAAVGNRRLLRLKVRSSLHVNTASDSSSGTLLMCVLLSVVDLGQSDHSASVSC